MARLSAILRCRRERVTEKNKFPSDVAHVDTSVRRWSGADYAFGRTFEDEQITVMSAAFATNARLLVSRRITL
jgi:hypothetical protein